ncbi:tRNA (adenosine(37)-N6)-threonylcarbamoyltransferase complex ATPase subunit type 1 TsaE [Mitsuaria sp. GD03876]|uniref:tRNA (adenosine(37)-N6)-threonylcarbamoyltransferase complex ATPase subunit type 1 TsaE n=1 Tax=Mitsuaria sp. GD03876 TaxID=2975399 RepID=UPI002447B186|nr:tRNA (adenosine(37)-N6)-threonylcarbamoyltransferase complex ATPase subunit type 1 TsaE [Mitsuaria sp. GD03876]MDH0867564.1 tRNA (adenosine(37)-N6)-threonylcarbamoyltransferase complex ATPase subunit type 1 TsaE [Mitsuaria sp. GD03876]
MSILETRPFHWPDEAACERFARALADCPPIDDVSIELDGGLGAGKTSLVRHLLRALGVTGRIKSPSYAVVEDYLPPRLNGRPAHHFDFYRFSDPREWADAGFRDLFAAPGLKLSEWPDKAAGMLPPPDLRLVLAVNDDDSRDVRAEAHTARGQALLAELAARLARPSD